MEQYELSKDITDILQPSSSMYLFVYGLFKDAVSSTELINLE
jgi:hypothetical protein